LNHPDQRPGPPTPALARSGRRFLCNVEALGPLTGFAARGRTFPIEILGPDADIDRLVAMDAITLLDPPAVPED
jgi:hypothetical protein